MNSVKSDRQKMVAKLDVLFSEVVRRRAIKRCGGCERCKHPKYDGQLPAWKQLQCAHNQSRGKKTVRWDVENAAGLCPACHMYLDGRPEEKAVFFRNLLGDERYDFLMKRAHATFRVELAIVEKVLREQLEK